MPGVDGIVTGLDTTAMINAIVSVQGIQLDTMEDNLSNYEDAKEKVAGLMSRMQDLSTQLESLADADKFVAYSGSVLNESVGTIELGDGAVGGSFKLDVVNLASAEREVSQGIADAEALDGIQEGTYSITYGGVATQVVIDSSNSSMTALAEAVNAIDGVSAYVMDTGAASDPFRLVIQGEDTGGANTIEVSLSGASGPGVALAFTEASTAANAKIMVDDIEAWSDTNTFDDVIAGVVLEVTEATTSSTTIRIDEDMDAVEESIQAFVDAYNEVQDYYDINTVYNDESGLKGPLVGDSTARRVMDRLGRMVSEEYAVGGQFSALTQLGISTESDGNLALDTEKLAEALREDADGVSALFTHESGFGTTMKTTIDDVFVDADNGLLVSRQESLQSSIDDAQDRIDDFSAYLDAMTERLRNQFNELEVTMGEAQSTQEYLSAMFSSSTSSS